MDGLEVMQGKDQRYQTYLCDRPEAGTQMTLATTEDCGKTRPLIHLPQCYANIIRRKPVLLDTCYSYTN